MNKSASLNPQVLFKALADDNRMAALMLLKRHGELCVCDLMTALQCSQPKISRHLALLRKAGILRVRRQQQWMYYSLDPQLPEWCLELLDTLLSNQLFPAALMPPALRDYPGVCPPKVSGVA